MRRLHGLVVTFTSPESHLVSLSITSLKKKKKSASERNEAESSARELSFDWPGHAPVYTYNWLTFTREISFLERSDHQSTFFSSSSSPLFFSFSSFSLFFLFFFFSLLSLWNEWYLNSKNFQIFWDKYIYSNIRWPFDKIK